ncbi:extracellular serine proteinase-like [Lytechinus pictus]|uniref:extracellular serine proteinase-like n=1 Tax=Lytechinus pictus TaxID=7653 RepID=UPI0030B9D25F
MHFTLASKAQHSTNKIIPWARRQWSNHTSRSASSTLRNLSLADDLLKVREPQQISKMELVFAILTALFSTGFARNVTFHRVAEPIEDHYIVVMKPKEDVVAVKKLIQLDRSGIFRDSYIKYTYTTAINGFSAKLSERALAKLLARDEIDYISQDSKVTASAVAQWGLDRIGQRNLPLSGDYSFLGNGSGVNVYVVDTGILPGSIFFGGRAKVAYDSVGDGQAYGIDCNGHGTHCAGTIGAEIFGVAPGVNLFGVRVLDCQGSGTAAGVIAGCDFVARSAMKPAIASMSLGGFAQPALDDAVRGMFHAGVTTMVAAGNSNNDSCLFSPSRVREAITVAATAINDRRASFSNYGSCVDLFAPGVNIPSAAISGEEYIAAFSGTSMACPHVAGAAAIALGKSGSMTPVELKTKMLEDTTPDVVADVSGSPNLLLYVP